MKIEYHADTDTLYISLRDQPAADTSEVAPGIVVEFDENGPAIGIEIDPASTVTDATKLETNMLVSKLKLRPIA